MCKIFKGTKRGDVKRGKMQSKRRRHQSESSGIILPSLWDHRGYHSGHPFLFPALHFQPPTTTSSTPLQHHSPSSSTTFTAPPRTLSTSPTYTHGSTTTSSFVPFHLLSRCQLTVSPPTPTSSPRSPLRDKDASLPRALSSTRNVC